MRHCVIDLQNIGPNFFHIKSDITSSQALDMILRGGDLVYRHGTNILVQKFGEIKSLVHSPIALIKMSRTECHDRLVKHWRLGITHAIILVVVPQIVEVAVTLSPNAIAA